MTRNARHSETSRSARAVGAILMPLWLSACMQLGPDFTPPEAELAADWLQPPAEGLSTAPPEITRWWQVFGDPVLDRLVDEAVANNHRLKLAGLRVIEARAQLGIAVGSQYPQVQRATGAITKIRGSESAANTQAGDLRYGQYDIGADASWEIDFWGRFQRGIESADAALLASIAGYDDALLLLLAQVTDTYTVIRATEEQLRIARENLELQRRSYQIADVLFRNGENSELDTQQAKTLLLSTEATIPALELSLRQARNAMATLLGVRSADIGGMLEEPRPIPAVPTEIAIGIPADLLRRRPDVRQAEFEAAAQSARIGIAEADLYPSFTLNGSISLTAASNTSTTRTGDTGFSELFRSDSLGYAAGPAFSWNILNYGRIRNNVRVQDARLQQLLESYLDTVLRAGQEVEDALAAFVGNQRQARILAEVVAAARRSVGLSLIQYREGLADYQRVLDSQQSLFAQQQREVQVRSASVRSLVALYKGLGGGWQIREGRGYVDEATRNAMQQRTDWGKLLGPAATEAVAPGEGARAPDW